MSCKNKTKKMNRLRLITKTKRIKDRLIDKIIKKDNSKKINNSDDMANLVFYANLTKDYSVLKI